MSSSASALKRLKKQNRGMWKEEPGHMKKGWYEDGYNKHVLGIYEIPPCQANNLAIIIDTSIYYIKGL